MSTMSNLPERPSTLSEKLLLLLSRKPGVDDGEAAPEEWTVENALSQLYVAFPDFLSRLPGRRVLDFGCGTGYQSTALARNGAKRVVGVDTNTTHVQRARQLAEKMGLGDQVTFTDHLGDSLKGRFDIVVSQNSFEHFRDPAGALAQMRAALAKEGSIFLTFGPLWFSPYGSHMHFFCKVPWLNLVFSENAIMKVRRHYIDDGAARYEDVEGGLNQMSVAKFERIVAASELRIQYKRYRTTKGLAFLGRLPGAREFFVNEIDAILANE
jgi:SAM-dependent methyltransferase